MPEVAEPVLPRIHCRFSCGAASAVATKLALLNFGQRVVVSYSDTGSEHEDNKRFLADCENWFGVKVTVLKSVKYKDTWDVWEKHRFMKGKHGTKCTGELKREPTYGFELPDDILVMGYTLGEEERAERIQKTNFERKFLFPLIAGGLDKAGCLAVLQRQGIDLPAMYKLGFRNNNCIGCPKGGRGYWNMIREHFPQHFARAAEMQRRFGPNHGFWPNPDGTRLMLDELTPDRGVQYDEADIECGVVCKSLNNALE